MGTPRIGGLGPRRGRRGLRRLLLVGCGWLASGATALAGGDAGDPAAAATASCAEQLALRVQQRYDAVRDLTARFEQTSWVAGLGRDAGATQTASGEVVFAKPGRMRWSYETPAPSLVVTDGEILWTYDATLKEAQKVAVGPGFLSGAAIQFLLGEGRLLSSFRVEAADCAADPVQLELVPREPATYERLSLEVRRESADVTGTRVLDLFGNVTEVKLRDLRTNSEPDASLFRFEPPEGTRVLEMRPPSASPPAPATP